jgi:adenosylhomocysteine nucleosidase
MNGTSTAAAMFSAAAICQDGRRVERIAVFAALQWECRTVLKHLRQVRRERCDAFTCWKGHAGSNEVWVVKTGMGVDRAAAAVDALGADGGWTIFVSTGCAGGLAADLLPGDLVIASVIEGDGTPEPLTTAADIRAGALATAKAARVPVREGQQLCSRTVLASRADKRAAAERGAVVVEMEGGAIAAGAAARGVPLLSVRAILDGAEHELSVPGTVIDPATGNLRPLALAGYLAAHPSAIGGLMAMQRMQNAARDSLERFFAAWLARETAPREES